LHETTNYIDINVCADPCEESDQISRKIEPYQCLQVIDFLNHLSRYASAWLLGDPHKDRLYFAQQLK